jgi:putative ABC transport system permease protein
MPSSGTRVYLEQVSKRLQPLSSKFHAAAPERLRARDAGCGKLRASARRIVRCVFVYLLRLILKNSLRHKLRTTLTVVGIVVAITAFGLLRTIVDAWYAGANASSSARLVTRNSISLVFSLPLNYAQRIRQVDGVSGVSWANWFGGVYITERNFFPQFAIDAPTYLDAYPEFVLSPEEKKAFLVDRQGCIVGRKLADKYGWKVGDQIPLRGTIYPGTWTFTLRGIFDGAEAGTDTSTFFFHFDYLNESIKRLYPRRGDQAGVFIEQLRDPEEAAAVSQAIDTTFRNSLAETLTETEKAFQLGFVAMSEAILVAIQAVSFVVIVIIMAVMANTMAMTARERYAEYATFKALGFGGGFVALLIFAESLGIALLGGLLGVALTFPLADAFASSVGAILSGVRISGETIALQIGAALVVGVIAAAVPAWRASRLRIVDGLRAIG